MVIAVEIYGDNHLSMFTSSFMEMVIKVWPLTDNKAGGNVFGGPPELSASFELSCNSNWATRVIQFVVLVSLFRFCPTLTCCCFLFHLYRVTPR